MVSRMMDGKRNQLRHRSDRSYLMVVAAVPTAATGITGMRVVLNAFAPQSCLVSARRAHPRQPPPPSRRSRGYEGNKPEPIRRRSRDDSPAAGRRAALRALAAAV